MRMRQKMKDKTFNMRMRQKMKDKTFNMRMIRRMKAKTFNVRMRRVKAKNFQYEDETKNESVENLRNSCSASQSTGH